MCGCDTGNQLNSSSEKRIEFDDVKNGNVECNECLCYFIAEAMSERNELYASFLIWNVTVQKANGRWCCCFIYDAYGGC